MQVTAMYDGLAEVAPRVPSARVASGLPPSAGPSADGAIGIGVEMPTARSSTLPGLG